MIADERREKVEDVLMHLCEIKYRKLLRIVLGEE